MKQDLRSFVEEYGKTYPGEFIRVTEPVGLQFDLQAIVLELERRRRFPILLFENVHGPYPPKRPRKTCRRCRPGSFGSTR